MNKQINKRIPQYLVQGEAMSIAAPEMAAEVARRLDEELRQHDMSVSDINRLWEFPREQIEEAGDEEESESEA
jgi:2-phosphoglycerate kinase